MLRYCKLWSNFGEKEFTHAQVDQILSKDKTTIGVILSQMRKAGWMVAKFDKRDARKRKYRLTPPETVINKIAKDGLKTGVLA
jgi:hypothetical protein